MVLAYCATADAVAVKAPSSTIQELKAFTME